MNYIYIRLLKKHASFGIKYYILYFSFFTFENHNNKFNLVVIILKSQHNGMKFG